MDKEESTEKNNSIEQTPENNGSHQKITSVGNTPLLNKISIQETYETNEEVGPNTNNEGMQYGYDEMDGS